MLNEQIASANNLASNSGALVYGRGNQFAVVPNSPAAKAGIKEGDIIVKFDGQPVNEDNPLNSYINKKKPGDTVTLTVLRDGKEQQIKVTFEEAPTSVQ